MCRLTRSVQLCCKNIVWNWIEYFSRFIISYMLNFIAFWYRICKLLWWVVPLNQCFWKIICLIKGLHCLAKKKICVQKRKCSGEALLATYLHFHTTTFPTTFLAFVTQSHRNRYFFVPILSTLKTFTSILRITSFCYYYVQAGKNILSNFNCFDKEAFQLASVHS